MHINIDIEGISCFELDFYHQGFIAACEVDKNGLRYKGASVYEGEQNSPESLTWVLRFHQSQEPESRDITYDTEGESAITLRKEAVNGLLEYAYNKVLISIEPTDILVTENWQPIRVLFRMQRTNSEKYFMRQFPQFDVREFPFVLCSGKDNYSIINVRDYKMQNFIIAPCLNARSQQAFFFLDQEQGFQIHFTSHEITKDGQQMQKWHLARIKGDFKQKMGKFGRLPVGSLDATLKLTLKYDRARAACNPVDYMQDYSAEKIKKLNAIPHDFVKYKPS